MEGLNIDPFNSDRMFYQTARKTPVRRDTGIEGPTFFGSCRTGAPFPHEKMFTQGR